MYAALHVLMICCFIERLLSKMEPRLWTVSEISISVLLRVIVCGSRTVVLTEEEAETGEMYLYITAWPQEFVAGSVANALDCNLCKSVAKVWLLYATEWRTINQIFWVNTCADSSLLNSHSCAQHVLRSLRLLKIPYLLVGLSAGPRITC